MENLTVETIAPLFDGFYDSLYTYDESYILENSNLEYNELIIDYKGYENAIGKEYTAQICYLLKEYEYISGYEYEKVVSPQFYNYSTDSIYCKIEFSKNNLEKIRAFLIDNLELFKTTLKEKFTSCSGFHSFYSNDSDIWIKGFDSLTLKSIQWCTILEFILLNDEQIDYNNMFIYEHVKESVSEFCYYDLDYENITPERLKEIEEYSENN